MSWEKFNAKKAIPSIPPSTILLDNRSSASTFTLDNWQDIALATHFIYLVDIDNKKVGLKPICELEADDSDLAIAYKISQNGHHRLSASCTKLLKSLPFQLVDEQDKRGKWILEFTYHDGIIVIDQQL